MSYAPISGYTLQTITQGGEVASGYYLKFYEANTTTPLSMATDAAGGTLLVKAKLNDNGMPISNPLDNSTVFIPHLPSQYRMVIYTTEADADANNTASAFVNIASTPVSPTASSVQYSGGFFTYGGTANAITLTSPSGLPSKALEEGDQIRFNATTPNTSSTTISIDGGSVITCKTPTGEDLPSGFIDGLTTATYDGTNLIITNEAAAVYHRSGDFLTYGGTANAITLTSANTLPSGTPALGDKVRFKATTPNTGAVTFQIDGGPVVSAVTPLGSSLPSGFITGQTSATYNGTNWVVDAKAQQSPSDSVAERLLNNETTHIGGQVNYTGANYQPDTSLGLGVVQLMKNVSGATISDNSIVPGTSLRSYYVNSSGALIQNTPIPPGSWKAVGGTGFNANEGILCVRVA